MHVLDTNVVLEIRKIGAGKADPNVEAWARELDTNLAYLSAMTIQELEHGVLLAEQRDPVTGETLRRWLDHDVREAFAERILPVDAEVARKAASLHVPNPAPTIDALIAATAMTHNMLVATRNTSDFERFEGLDVVNPWTTRI